MANPTTNYGFVLPTSTDLVTDLPADFDVALQGVDTRLKALQPGTTLGDIAYSSATANTNTRLGVGSTGQVLTVASGVPSWATPASGGGLTLLYTTALTGSSVTMSDISQSYKNLRLIIKNVYASSVGDMQIRLNGDTGSNYNVSSVRNKGTTLSGGNGVSATLMTISSVSTTSNTAIQKTFAVCFFPRYTDTDQQEFTTTALSYWDSLPTYFAQNGTYDGTAAITSMTIIQEAGNFSGGTAYLYGES